MERITNVRISTLTKSVSHDGDVSIVSVGLNNGHVFAVDSEGNTHDMGAIIISNIEIATPQVASEGCGCNTPNANVIAKLLRGVDGVDGITPDMSDYYEKITVDSKLKQKQDLIRDLATIREGAAKGATAVQPASLADYVSKDDVDAELSETSANPVQNQAVHTALEDIAYAFGQFLNQKQGTISDLEAIRDGAAKGATALQSSDVDSEVSETSTNPVQNKAVAGAFYEIVGLLDAILSSVDGRFDSKQDKLVSGENIKTINGETIVGEGNIEIEGGSVDLEGYATEEYVDNAVAEVNVKGEDGYVYSNGEKVDMRFTRSLIPVGTSIPANANLNTVAYLKVGKYYCSQNVDAKTITNCPATSAFSMEVFNPLSPVVDNETTDPYVYRIRILTVYNTGVQYVQYATVGSTVNKWTYNAWYVVPRSPFTLNSNKKGGSAALGSATQGVYINSEGTFVKMSYTLGKSVPSSAVFTDTKVTAVGNHYTPVEDASVVIEAPEGEVVIGLKRDAAGHVVGVMSTPMSEGGSSEYESNIEDKTLAMPNAVGGIAKGTTISALEGKTYNEMFDDLLFPTVNPTFTAPSASIAFKSYSSTQEVGATGPTASNFTVGYNAGAITLNGTKQANRGGTQDTANSFIYVNGSASNKTLPSKVTLGSTTFKYRAAFAEGPQPKNNKGDNYSSPLAAGTVDSSAITLNGTYPWFASTSSATSTNPVVKQSLVAWNATAGNMSTGQFTVQPSGTLPQVFKLPRQIKTLQLKNALNGQMEDVANIATDYTESTETINIGGTDVTYYVYTYKGSTRGSVTLLAKF